MLIIDNVNKSFNNKKVLDHVSLSVASGSVCVLLGSSGVGKSTLLRILNNLESIDSGMVTLDGKALNLSTVNATCTVGMVFQQFNLFNHMTVERNITFALEKTAKKNSRDAHKRAHELLVHYGLADKAHMYPSQLSGGQKQRLAIARAVALDPKIICMDEPTSALDPRLTTHVAHTLQELARRGYTVLVATHDTLLVEKLDCDIHLMEHGRVVESAQSADLKKSAHQYPKISAFIAGSIE